MSKIKSLLPIITVLSIASCSPSGGGVSSIQQGGSSSSNSSLPGSSSFVAHSFEGILLNNPQKAFNRNDTVASKSTYVESLNSLSKDLYKNIFDGGNKIYSTISIANCFSMLLEGAKENSKKELEDFLHYDDSFNHLDEIKNSLLRNAINDGGNETYLDISQSFWVDDSFRDDIKQAYINTLENYYYAEAFSGELKSDRMHQALADYINDKTHNFLNVKKEDFDNYAGVLWLLNTIYLKSQWMNSFYESANIDDVFANLNGTEKTVTYMRKEEDSCYLASDNYALASIPLQHGLKFNILLPNKDGNYEAILSSDEALNALHDFPTYMKQASRQAIQFQIPQFRVQESIDLPKLLKEKMGVTEIFDKNLANLTDIATLKPDENLYVSNAKHEAGLEIKNQGLEAAAYTVIEVEYATAITPPVIPTKFIVDHPFAYSITNIDGIPLFTGVTTIL